MLAPFAAFARPLAALTAFAALTGLSVFAAFTPRALLSTLLLLAACLLTWLLPAAAPFAAPLCALLALVALLPDMREALLRRRATRRKPVRA